MTAAWWLTVLALATLAAFAAGWIVRAEMETWRRAGTIDFTRKRLGQ